MLLDQRPGGGREDMGVHVDGDGGVGHGVFPVAVSPPVGAGVAENLITRPKSRPPARARRPRPRSEEHTSELQSLMRISYAVSCLKKNIHPIHSARLYYL